MRLYYNRASPYARKVLVTAHELGLVDRLDLVLVDPWADPPDLLAATPLAKVPALVVADTTLTESTAICEALGAIAGLPTLSADARLDRDARLGIAQGLIDAGFGIVIERRRPSGAQWPDWIDRLRRAVERTIARVARPDEGRFDTGDVTLACALGYLDFRLGEIAWRAERPDLADWLDLVATRPSMIATKP